VQRRLTGVSCIGAEIGSFSWPIRNLRRKPRAPLIEGAGKVSGDKEMQREGKADKAKGDVHKAAGDVKDADPQRSRQHEEVEKRKSEIDWPPEGALFFGCRAHQETSPLTID
jgi:uncharacterized protein YjbJ (UPF0337 family)